MSEPVEERICKDAVEAYRDELRKQYIGGATAWVIIPVVTYNVTKGLPKRQYMTRNTMADPIVLISAAQLSDLESMIEARADGLPPGHELSLSTKVIVGYKDGKVIHTELLIFDGAPDLYLSNTQISELQKAYTKVLRSGNGYHFYGGYLPTSFRAEELYDQKWVAHALKGEGRIRMTCNVKSEIKLIPKG